MIATRPKGAIGRSVFVTLAVGFLACKPPAESAVPAETFLNVQYGVDAFQAMDVYLPEGRNTSTPVVVLVHGGGWSGGDKSIFTAADIARFTDAGYAAVNINYRLASNAANIHDPILSQDVTAALDFIAAHAGQYQVSASKFALVGHSAGAHLSLLASYKYDPARRIKAVASLSGPTDLNDSTFLAVGGIRGTIETFIGVTQSAAPVRWSDASPVSAATSTSAPTIILQGAVDALVPKIQGDKLDARLAALQVPREYRVFPTYNHDLGYAAIGHFPDDVLNPVLAWLATYLR